MNITQWEPGAFELETNSVWSFPKHALWATHDTKYRGGCSPYAVRNLLLRYSSEGDLILDQFAGGGTTLVEAKLLGRRSIGVDINPDAIEICREKTAFDWPDSGKVAIQQGDARNLDSIQDESIDFICTQPPYTNIIRYSKDMLGDISCMAIPLFLDAMKDAAAESFRVLKPGKFCAFLMCDTRKDKHIVPIGFEVLRLFEAAGFKTKEIIIKKQKDYSVPAYWKSNSLQYNFLLIAHEYLFILSK